jgi:hypothetical protein
MVAATLLAVGIALIAVWAMRIKYARGSGGIVRRS